MHTILLEAILTTAACRSYAQSFADFHSHRAGLESNHPFTILRAIVCRWSIVIPLLLCCWLRKSFVQPTFLWALCQIHPDKDALSVIIESFAAAAKSNSVLMGQTVSASDHQRLSLITELSCKLFFPSQLIQCQIYILDELVVYLVYHLEQALRISLAQVGYHHSQQLLRLFNGRVSFQSHWLWRRQSNILMIIRGQTYIRHCTIQWWVRSTLFQVTVMKLASWQAFWISMHISCTNEPLVYPCQAIQEGYLHN